MELDGLSDEELIRIIKSKNECSNSALGILYTKYYSALCGFSKNVLGNKEDAEDNVNDVFFKFCLNSDFYRNKNNATFKSWIFDVTYNTAVNKLRRRDTRNKFLEKNMDESQFYNENEAYSNENMQIIIKELGQMSEIHSKIVYMREFFDIDYSKIEKSFNILPSTCRGLHRKACTELRTSLIEKYGEEQFLS
jgi:RNA polymerase sigma-70 factor, ECF subfamily